MKFSKTKFLSFSKQKQEKKILDFITNIESNWENVTQRMSLLFELNKCLKYMNKAIIKQIDELTLRDFLSFAVPLEQKFGRDKQDKDIVIYKKDGETNNREKIPVSIILNNLRSAFNVGSIIRSAECFGISKIYFCGYTPNPDHPKVKKTAMGTENHIIWEQNKSLEKLIIQLKNEKNKIYALETTKNAKVLSKTEFNSKVTFIFGNEALGIPKRTLGLVDEIIQIPLFGWKNSLNVGVCAAVTFYELSRQLRNY